MMQSDSNFDKILDDINNCTLNQKRDKFTQKYAFVTCNEFYDDKAGLPNLPSTKDDFSSIKRTIHMMDIKQENTYELVDTNHKEIEEQFERMCDRILATVPELKPKTGIGHFQKFQGAGILWQILKKFVFRLIDDGIIRVYESKGMKRVDLCGLHSIEVSYILF